MTDYLAEATAFAKTAISWGNETNDDSKTAALVSIMFSLLAIAERLDKVIADRNGVKAVQVRQEK